MHAAHDRRERAGTEPVTLPARDENDGWGRSERDVDCRDDSKAHRAALDEQLVPEEREEEHHVRSSDGFAPSPSRNAE